MIRSALDESVGELWSGKSEELGPIYCTNILAPTGLPVDTCRQCLQVELLAVSK